MYLLTFPMQSTGAGSTRNIIIDSLSFQYLSLHCYKSHSFVLFLLFHLSSQNTQCCFLQLTRFKPGFLGTRFRLPGGGSSHAFIVSPSTFLLRPILLDASTFCHFFLRSLVQFSLVTKVYSLDALNLAFFLCGWLDISSDSVPLQHTL